MGLRLAFLLVATIALTGIANVSLAVPSFPGDVDDDGDVDNSDLAIIVGHIGHEDPFIPHGDVDGDGDNDADDFAIAVSEFAPSGFGAYFGPYTVDFNPAQLIYNPATGQVLLDQTNAPGGAISTFVLSSSGAFNAPGTANFPFGGTLFEDAPSVIAQTDPDTVLSPLPSPGPSLGFATNPHDLGTILPPGLDLAGLSAALSGSRAYVGTAGTGVRSFELVVLPEPASLALCLMSLVAFSSRRR